MRGDKKAKTINTLRTKLFEMVGLKYVASEDKDRAEDWYLEHTWTEEEQEEFKTFGVDLLRKEERMNKRAAEKEMSWFILGYGWKTGASSVKKI